jgi:hypothetical protein
MDRHLSAATFQLQRARVHAKSGSRLGSAELRVRAKAKFEESMLQLLSHVRNMKELCMGDVGAMLGKQDSFTALLETDLDASSSPCVLHAHCIGLLLHLSRLMGEAKEVRGRHVPEYWWRFRLNECMTRLCDVLEQWQVQHRELLWGGNNTCSGLNRPRTA